METAEACAARSEWAAESTGSSDQSGADASGHNFIHEFERIKGHLRDESGVSYTEFARSLAPRYMQVWLGIGAGYLAIVVAAIGIVAIRRYAVLPAPVTVIAGALVFGWWIHYLLLFLHEATHFNLARNRALNDVLARTFLCSLLGLDLRAFRAAHFEHHRYLGTPNDTETSYFSALTPRFIFESLIGIRIARAVMEKKRSLRRRATPSEPLASQARILTTVALHGAIIGASGYAGQYVLAASWMLAMVPVAPSLNLIRQILEHRDLAAKADTDYTRVAHGALARIFGAGPLASTFGAAGFNHHLLHHLEPQVSCTRLHELEHFLDRTPVGPRLAECRFTYLRAFTKLMRA